MPIGPQLPHSPSGKRKRLGKGDDDDSSSDGSVGPQLPVDAAAEGGSVLKRPRVVGPSLPQTKDHVKHEVESASGDTSDSSDDDDFGPSLPTKTSKPDIASTPRSDGTVIDTRSSIQAPAVAARDEWMTIAPTSGDWSQRIDPTKIKSRKFNTGKGSAPAAAGTDSWHETPEQKQARLQRQVLGVKNDKGSKSPASAAVASDQDAETAQRMKEYNKQRGPSLYVAHQKKQDVERDDDPSARAFDREKDIGGGLQLNATQRREMMKKSGDFNSRFSTAKYL